MNRAVVLLLALALVPAPAAAVDGVVLITQATVLAAGGFPYTITQPGSYRLAGNLTVSDANTTAIVIAQDNVTIDLNGFTIAGPVDCAGVAPCGTTFSGYGIRAGTDLPEKGYANITIRNGTIRGMGADAVHVLGDSVLVEYLHARSNGLSGIVVRAPGGATQTNLILYHNNVQRNGSYGIKAYAGVITDNAVSDSGHAGISIQVGGGTVARNLVSHSQLTGLDLAPTVSYYGNTLAGNNGGGAQVGGGVNVGQNVCNGVVCPGAGF